jgi:Flp pilus assembly pilin Flp
MAELFARRFLRDDMGQDLIEYVLLLAFIALVTIVGLQSVGTATNSKYQVASTAITDADPNGGGNPGNPTPGAGTPGQGNPGSGNPGQGGGSSNGNGGTGNSNGNGGTGNGKGNGGGKP